jgi:pimeloyl-ACP methyl ester carboxylesterase
MPNPPQTRRRQPARPQQKSTPAAPAKPVFEIVDPRWLLKALGVCFAGALVCGYATLCLLFYQGSWQLILHPTPTVDRTPATAGLAFSTVHFDSTETGQPRLTGWWIPAAQPSGFQSSDPTATLLYLHDGSGSLSDTLSTLTLLHQTGLNIFAIDYRGFGASDSSLHPSAERMAQDTSAALDYLTATRHINANSIVPYGTGLGAALAVNLAQAHHDLPAVILDNPNPDPASAAVAAHPSDPVPVRLLFGDQFNIARPLATLSTPKLLIAGGPSSLATQSDQYKLATLFTHAASPHITVTLPPASSNQTYLDALSRFLDQYLHQTNPSPPISSGGAQ